METFDQAITQKSEEICRDILAGPELEPFRRAAAACSRRAEDLRAAQRFLIGYSRRLLHACGEASRQVDDAIIDASIAAAEPDLAALLATFEQLRSAHDAAARAHRRIVEELLPSAEIDYLEAAAEELETQAAAVHAAASERLRKTTELMAQAAEHEGSIVFDPGQTLSGALQARAEILLQQAADHRRWARERRDRHHRLAQQL
ncbi:MAG: hypothetical protein K2X35_13025 [Bryobacteraceae bacterium]|nr:hypothetical protein [Bryobacteraceae bacterium]